MTQDRDDVTVLVTGASGNLGQKLLRHFLDADWTRKVVGVDPRVLDSDLAGHSKLEFHVADLADIRDRRWVKAFEGVDSVVHLAARHPYPDATWSDASASMDITLNVAAAMHETGGQRFVFASSNHVMGGYLDVGLGAGELTVDLPPRPGLTMREGEGYMTSTAYATAKTMGERVLANWASAAPDTRSCVSVRIGWCRPNDNRPEEISVEAVPGVSATGSEDLEGRRILKWARDMWLSNRDLQSLFSRAVRADASTWPTAAIVVNGNSANTGMPWNIENARQLLAYAPQDNLYATVKAD